MCGASRYSVSANTESRASPPRQEQQFKAPSAATTATTAVAAASLAPSFTFTPRISTPAGAPRRAAAAAVPRGGVCAAGRAGGSALGVTRGPAANSQVHELCAHSGSRGAAGCTLEVGLLLAAGRDATRRLVLLRSGHTVPQGEMQARKLLSCSAAAHPPPFPTPTGAARRGMAPRDA